MADAGPGADGAPPAARTPRAKRLKLAAIVIAVLLLNPFSLLGLWLGTAYWSNAHPSLGANVESVSWLPADARNVSYYRTYSWTAYEFDIGEAAFRKWAAGEYDLKEISEPRSIMRYSYKNFARQWRGRRESDAYEAEKEKHFAAITDGLYHFETWRNGGSIHVVYDRQKQKAYYQSNPR
jgi:hypothetical protein